MLFWDTKIQNADPLPVSQNGRTGFPPKAVELIAVRVGGQPFGLLLKQVFNIARPENDLFSVITPNNPDSGYGEIFYRGQIMRVVELARKFQFTPAESLADSKILISGQLVPGGNIQQPFGISVDEIIGVWHIGLENLRLLDEWVCRKRLGRLIWGVALVDSVQFGLQQQTGVVRPTSQFNDLMGETVLLASSSRPDRIGPQGRATVEEGRLATAGIVNSAAIPLMLLDLEILRAELFRY